MVLWEWNYVEQNILFGSAFDGIIEQPPGWDMHNGLHQESSFRLSLRNGRSFQPDDLHRHRPTSMCLEMPLSPRLYGGQP